MLRFLRITHLAVIDSVEVELEPGLNVLTGETGAGKSILVGAVGLLLGGRASGDLVRTGEETATIEAIFDSGVSGGSQPSGIAGASAPVAAFSNSGDDELLVRREVSSQGRSRGFINGALVTAGALKDLSASLIELHGQHEHHVLLDPASHLGVLDSFGNLRDLGDQVEAAFDALGSARTDLAQARAASRDREARLDLIKFRLAELERAQLKSEQPDEDAALAALRQVLVSAERIERLCLESYTALYESDGAVLSNLGQVWRRVAELAAIEPRFGPYLEARDGIKSQLEDLASFLRRYANGIEASPARLQEIEERLALLERLKRKYGPTLTQVIGTRDELARELSDLAHIDDTIDELERRHSTARAHYQALAEELSQRRRLVAAEFAGELQRLLADLALGQTRFDVRFNASGSSDSGGSSGPMAESAWTGRGIDEVEFFVSPNPGEELRPLARIVSGGELSRMMLAIKTLTFRARLTGARTPGTGAPGLIFDEVDAGIGGRVADVVGRKLRALGSAFQVICITHLPQIAAYADTHFHIDKVVSGGRARTSVKRLDERGRVEELARMLGGEAISDGLRRSAREMLMERSGKGGRDSGESAPVPAPRREPSGRGESERRKRKR
ncbi:MAG TPA: DNA repair protein RecN [Vicinamibacterales bacterium]|nr:DNA repair protein RecN [Vicinamibacterales bacterium]